MISEEKITKLKEKIKEIYKDNAGLIIESLRIKKITSFRIGGNKEEVLSNLSKEGYIISEGPIPDSFVVKGGDKKLSESSTFKNGEIYIQELSSMVPAIELDPKEGEKILDLCAAPGSKTTQINEITNGKANITAIEKVKTRFFHLKGVLEIHNCKNVELILSNGIGLEKKFPQFLNYFDKVLVDAPCTNEARISLDDPKTYKFWNPKKYKDLSRVQKGLIISGIRMLKEGGVLVYSTCTFSVEENELVIDWLLSKFDGLKVGKIDFNSAKLIPGITNWKGKNLNPQIKNTVRILPNALFSSFFIAKILRLA